MIPTVNSARNFSTKLTAKSNLITISLYYLAGNENYSRLFSKTLTAHRSGVEVFLRMELVQWTFARGHLTPLCQRIITHVATWLINQSINWWRRQCSKGARSFRGQNLFERGHPDALSFLKKVDDLLLVVALKTKGRQRRWDCFTVKIKQSGQRSDIGTIFIFCSHHYRSKAIGRAEPGRWIFHPARSFDLARPGVAPPLPSINQSINTSIILIQEVCYHYASIQHACHQTAYHTGMIPESWREYRKRREHLWYAARSFLTAPSPQSCDVVTLNYLPR